MGLFLMHYFGLSLIWAVCVCECDTTPCAPATAVTCRFAVCLYVCVCVCVCVIGLPRYMPYLRAMGFEGSVLFHTSTGKWVTLELDTVSMAAHYKGQERPKCRGCLTPPTLWPLKITVKWLTYLTNAIVQKVCLSSAFPHRICVHTSHEVREETSKGLSRPCWNQAFIGCDTEPGKALYKCVDTRTQVQHRDKYRNWQDS